MTQEQKQEFTRRISQENHSGLILVLEYDHIPANDWAGASDDAGVD